MGVTELLFIGFVFLLIPIATHYMAYKWGKAKGRNEALEEKK